MPWILLITAGLFEVVWALTMKQSEGFTKVGPSVITIIAMLISFGLLAMAMRKPDYSRHSGSCRLSASGR